METGNNIYLFKSDNHLISVGRDVGQSRICGGATNSLYPIEECQSVMSPLASSSKSITVLHAHVAPSMSK